MTKTSPTAPPDHLGHNEMPSPGSKEIRRPRTTTGAVVALVVLAVAIIAVIWASRTSNDDEDGWQSVDLSEQGAPDSVYEANGARLQRRADGLFVEVDVPTPEPGAYEYPTRDMIPPWVETHPVVGQGARDAPEIFTLWLFAFNDPGSCTEGQCDSDDIGVEAAARGGVYQIDGRIAADDTVQLTGNVRLGQSQLDGAPLADPLDAEVHIAIAPHGRALSGADRTIQLNTPIGNPALWWGARFPAP
jgi:hypothetical protein